MTLSECTCQGCELKTLFFQNVGQLDIESICSKKTEHHFAKGEYIFTEGDSITEFTYLKTGLVKLFKTSAPDLEQIICFARPLDFVSLLSVFSKTQYQYSVVALEDSVTCSLNLDEVRNIAQNNGKFAIDLLEKLNNAADNIITNMLEMKKKRLNGRIAYILLYFSEQVYKSKTFELPVTRKEIAEFIGMTTENVIRTLSEFRKDGIIKIFGKGIEIIDIERLQKINTAG